MSIENCIYEYFIIINRQFAISCAIGYVVKLLLDGMGWMMEMDWAKWE